MKPSFTIPACPFLQLLLFLTGLLSFTGCEKASLASPGPLVLDMVHHNPGEPRYVTRYEDPAVIKTMGYTGKVYFLFDAPTIAINWESVDPDIFPPGSPGRAWVDAKALEIDAQHAACKAAGLEVYAMADLVLFPKTLIAKYGLEKTFGDPQHPQTQKFLRAMLNEMFDRFPLLDGLVVRIGETYLHDAPHHRGHINDKSDAEKTIIPLTQLLREEVCVKRNKKLIFRTWLSFDVNAKTYQAVSAAVEPHPNLIFSIKQCEGDFHRGNAFSKVLGMGRHPQLIEVQCAREYEGKGAYPNYIAHGVIEGFEEHRLSMKPEAVKSLRQVAANHDLFAGVWTWTRGGGWGGPYIKDELWCDLNAWVMAQWARDPAQSEETLFYQYAAEKLGLHGADAAKFRKLCLLSADAVLRGKTTTRSDHSPWWSRDFYMTRPPLPQDPLKRQRVLEEKAQAVALWEEIVKLAQDIQFPDPAVKEHVVISSKYGLTLYRIYHLLFELAAAGEDPSKLRPLLKAYDQAWTEHLRLPKESAMCATPYDEHPKRHHASTETLDKFIPRLRAVAEKTP